jgi:hypothetical protein
MVVIVPLACTSITDQQWIQVTFVTARFVMVILMVGTVAAAHGAEEPHFGSQVGPVNDISLAKPSNIIQVTMTCIFGSTFLPSVPIMADESRSKTGLNKVFGVALTLSYVSNLLPGILLALFFGQDQPDSSKLNWENYHGGTGEATRPRGRQRYLATLFYLRRSALSLYTPWWLYRLGGSSWVPSTEIASTRWNKTGESGQYFGCWRVFHRRSEPCSFRTSA